MTRALRPILFMLPLLAVAALPARADDPAFLTGGIGWFDFNDNEQTVAFNAEYRSNRRLGPFKPFAGAMVSGEGALYGYGGVLVDIYFGRRLVLSPNFAAGLYSDGSGKDLGSVIEFRSGIELAYRFDNRARAGLAVHHISNASISDNNPGTEIFTLFVSWPLK